MDVAVDVKSEDIGAGDTSGEMGVPIRELGTILVRNITPDDVSDVPIFVELPFADDATFILDGLVLHHEVVEPQRFWISIPSIPGDGNVTIRILEPGFPASSPWDDYEVVAHFDGNLEDSALLTPRDGEGGLGAYQAIGVFGEAASFTTPDSSLKFPGFVELAVPEGQLSVSFWHTDLGGSGEFGSLVDLRRGIGCGPHVRLRSDAYQVTFATSGDECATGIRSAIATLPILDGARGLPAYVTIDADATRQTFRLSVNGVSMNKEWVGMNRTTDVRPFIVGGAGDDSFISGSIDELRIERRIRPAAWHAFQRALVSEYDRVVTVTEK